MLCSMNTVGVVECSSRAWAPVNILIRYGTIDSRLTARATSHCTHHPLGGASNGWT